jgi:hypothetical protein
MLRRRSTGHHDQVASNGTEQALSKMYVDFNGYRNCLRAHRNKRLCMSTLHFSHHTKTLHNALPNCVVCIFTNHISTPTDVSYDTHIFN